MAPALMCQPLGFAPLIPIFHIIGSVSVNKSLPGGLEFEHINDVNGIFQYRGVWHVFHQCCQNHWDHVASTDLIHWKKLPSPVHPDQQHWYDESGSYDGSAAILPPAGGYRHGPVILVDNNAGALGRRSVHNRHLFFVHSYMRSFRAKLGCSRKNVRSKYLFSLVLVGTALEGGTAGAVVT